MKIYKSKKKKKDKEKKLTKNEKIKLHAITFKLLWTISTQPWAIMSNFKDCIKGIRMW